MNGEFLEDHYRRTIQVRVEREALQHRIKILENKSHECFKREIQTPAGLGFLCVGGAYDGRTYFLTKEPSPGFRIVLPDEEPCCSTSESLDHMDRSLFYRHEVIRDRNNHYRLLVCEEIRTFNSEVFEVFMGFKNYVLRQEIRFQV